MKHAILICLVSVALAGSFALGRGQAVGEDKEGGNPLEDMAAWMELGKPGPEHAELAKMNGAWECEVKSFHQPGAEPVVEKGKAAFSMEMGGLFQKQEYSGAMSGMPFTGLGYTAFNNATKKYEATWMDSMGSGIMSMIGTKKGDTVTYRGHFFGPGATKIEARYEMTKVSESKHTTTMYMDMGAGEAKSMEMTYTRVP